MTCSNWRSAAGAALLAVSVATLAAPDPKAARLYEDALTRFDQRDVKGAIIQLKNALQIDNSLLPVHLLLGRALLEDGQPAAAEIALNEAVRLGVSLGEAALPLARSLVDQGKPQAVLTDPRFATAGVPAGTRYSLLLLKASAAADVGSPQEALRLVEEARALRPGEADSWLSEVALRIRSREFTQATAAADKALALAPGSADAIYHRAQVDHVRGDLQGAVKGYGAVLAVDAKHVEALVSRGGLLIDLGRIDDAALDVATLREARPKDPRGAFLAALVAEKKGQADVARQSLKEVTTLIDPAPLDYIKYRPQILMLNGLAHFGLGEREAAKPYLEAYSRLDPAGGVAKILARILLAEGNVEPAAAALQRYLRAHPSDAQAQALYASALTAQGRTDRAVNVAREGLNQREDPALRAALGMSLLGSGKVSDAVTELETAYRKDPSQVQAAATLVGLYLQQGQSDKGLKLAEALAARQPGSAAIQALLGQARVGARDAAGARRALDEAVRLDPELTSAQVLLARLDGAQGKVAQAEARLTGLLSKNERDAGLMFELAALMQRLQRTTDAQRWLERAVVVADSRDYRPALALADLHLKAGRREDALRVTKVMAANAANDIEPQIALARMLLANQDRAGAQQTLNSVTRLAAFDPGLQLEVALLQRAAGNLPGAAYSLDKSLSGRPDFLPAMVAMVEVDVATGRLADAETRARRILQQHPRLGIGHSLLGDVHWARQQRDVALRHYRDAHATQPDTRSAVKLATALDAERQTAAAVKLLTGWVAKRQDDAEALRMLAALHARRGEWPAAQALYQRLLVARPGDALLLNEMANALLPTDTAAALKVAEQALAAAPSDPRIIDTAGWVLFKNGRSDRALQLLRDARLRQPANPTIRYHLAAVLAQTGRTAEAKEELRSALASTPQFEGDAEARELLKSLP